ncbi:MAG: hypothetical protein KBD25_01030 [Rickettsiaceae bacterium]|nr:hypothetical protein [Rickettsiaceae bacterium]
MHTHGGSRPGAGRKKLQKQVKFLRVPAARVHEVKSFLKDRPILIPIFSSRVQAGFPSPADDYVEEYLDLNTKLHNKLPTTGLNHFD